jgi:hypothetical protein
MCLCACVFVPSCAAPRRMELPRRGAALPAGPPPPRCADTGVGERAAPVARPFEYLLAFTTAATSEACGAAGPCCALDEGALCPAPTRRHLFAGADLFRCPACRALPTSHTSSLHTPQCPSKHATIAASRAGIFTES